MRHYCTYFDRNYLPRGLALHASLERHETEPFTLHVLCLDDFSREYLTGLGREDIRPIALADLEAWDPRLPLAATTRSRIEYYFTLTPALPLYVLETVPGAGMVTYLDADLYFYSAPEPAYAELGDGSVAMISHRLSPHMREAEEEYGIYNVGFLIFRDDENGRSCLRWWLDRCVEWCYDRVEPGRFADQKYLEQWPELFDGVVVLEHPGLGIAPWNVETHPVREDGGALTVRGEPLIFYHFHKLQLVTPLLFEPGLDIYRSRPSRTVRRTIYAAYVRELLRWRRTVRMALPSSLREPVRPGIRDLVHRMVHRRPVLLLGPLVLEVRLPLARPMAWLRALRGERAAVDSAG